MNGKNTRRGFTLIELLVVVIIIGILAAIALPQYQKAVLKSRTAELQTFMAHVEKAMDLYVLENGYPSTGDFWDELEIDMSSYCNSIDAVSGYMCNANNFMANLSMDSNGYYLKVFPSSSIFGPSSIKIDVYKNGIKEKECRLEQGSLKAKPFCDALKASDPSWDIELGCAG